MTGMAENEVLQVRPARDADMGAVTAIYAHYVLTGTSTFEIKPPDHREMLKRREDVLSRGYPWLVAERNGQILGYAYANLYRVREAYRFTLEDSIYVAASAGGKGIGTALLGRLLEESAAAGARQMVAVIGDSANKGSIALHSRMGFVHAGLLPAVGFKFGRWVDSVLMQRALGPGAASLPE